MNDDPVWRRYLRLTRRDVAADVDDELAFHIAMRVERNLALGMDAERARREAMHRFGDAGPVRRELVAHDARKRRSDDRREYVADLLQDLRFGVRSLRHAPGFAAAAILTLALGIGANTAIFSVVEGIILRPLPFVRPHELVSLGPGSGGEFLALRERLRSIPQLALYATQTHPVDDGETVQRLEGAAMTTNLLSVLGVSPLLGRGFTDEEGQFGNAAVLLLSHQLWLRQFDGSPDVIGTRVSVEGMLHTVVGVMGPDFRFPSAATEYWQPYAFNPENVGYTWGVGGKQFIGRLAPGATITQAQREARETWPGIRTLNPLWDPGPKYGRDATVNPLHAEIVGRTASVVWILFGCVILVLLIACVNVANLLLARATARAREFSVRASLGGGRGRLVRQLVTESLLMSVLGAALGVALAALSVRVIVAALPASVPRAHEIAVNGTVLAFAAVIAIICGLVFGIVPALRATKRIGAATTLSGVRTTAGIGHHRLTGALVVTEMALAVLLAIGASLLVRSFQALRSVEPGFEPSHVIAARLTPPAASYQDPARVTALYASVLARLEAAPGVRGVALVDKLPMAQSVWGMAARIEGQFEDGTRVLPDIGHYQQVSPAYFATMGIPLVRGRAFTDADREDQVPVAIVSLSLARRFWPDETAIGKRIGYAWNSPWMTIVGVVADTKQDSLRDTLATSLYVPWQQRTRMSGSEMWVLARTASDPGAMAGMIRTIVGETDRTVPVSDVRTMDMVIANSLGGTRFTTLLVGGFALAALVLGAIGIYGVMSYLVSQRTQEMGVRLALGAPPRAVIRLVVSRAMGLAAVGTLAGIAAAVVVTRSLGSLLYDVSATDPLTFAIVPLLFLLVAALASYGPARRAARVDPVQALHTA
jgi:putative ABC transport system permease protein